MCPGPGVLCWPGMQGVAWEPPLTRCLRRFLKGSGRCRSSLQGSQAGSRIAGNESWRRLVPCERPRGTGRRPPLVRAGSWCHRPHPRGARVHGEGRPRSRGPEVHRSSSIHLGGRCIHAWRLSCHEAQPHGLGQGQGASKGQGHIQRRLSKRPLRRWQPRRAVYSLSLHEVHSVALRRQRRRRRGRGPRGWRGLWDRRGLRDRRGRRRGRRTGGHGARGFCSAQGRRCINGWRPGTAGSHFPLPLLSSH